MIRYTWIRIRDRINYQNILEVKVDTIRPHPNESGTEYMIAGTVVCADGNRGKKLLAERANSQNNEKVQFPVKWRVSSPGMAKKYRQIPDSDSSRFRIIVSPPFASLSIVLGLEDGTHIKLGEVRSIETLIGTNLFLPDFIKDNIQLFKEADTYLYWRDILNGVPQTNRDNEWLKSSIFLKCLVQKEGRGAFEQIKKLKKSMNSEGDNKMFLHFWSELSGILHPLTINSHGYKNSLRSKSQAALWSEAEKLLTILGKLGYDGIIDSGTLLGYIREGDFIGHDDDIDLAIMLKSNSLEEISKEWFALRSKLNRMGILDKSFVNNMHCKLKSDLASVDLFPAWIIDERLYIFPHTFGELDASAFYPLHTVVVQGARISVPNHASQILELNYGKNWASPDPSWSFDWKDAYEKFKDFIAALKKEKEDSV